MLTKFQTKSNRVKGLSFHPQRPWVLTSLHTGVIQLWDYRMGTLIDTFEEHEGPVRGVHFHRTQPLFVSGGDDYKVRVWNYKLRRCLFTLTGHLDYIRTVQFHDENPWILTASDDQTIRIWNWQSRTCVSVLTGHNHYVMCAAFHPKEDLVMSASLDTTVRVWDISGLRSKNLSPNDGPRLPPVQADIFGSADAVVKWVMEGHDRGVNWASFHPSLPIFVSGADDKHVKLWRHNDTKAWEVDTFRGHFNNVSCVLFHPRQDIFISNSEDKSIRVWDIQKRVCLHTFRREHDRFWILAAHPEMNLFAAGHDNGMMVFKLERERPGYCVHNNTLFFVKDRYIRTYDFATRRDVPVMPVRRTGSTKPPRTMSYNPAENCVLLTWDGSGYELYTIPKDTSRPDTECKRGVGTSAVFVARNRFAVLDSAHKIIVKNLKNEQTMTLKTPHPTIDWMFYAGTGCLLLRGEEKMYLLDVQRRKVINEVSSPRVKHVIWSQDMQYVALISKHAIVICNRKLEQLSSILETIRLKSAAWDENNVLIYSTPDHIKYCLTNGDNGVIRTMPVPLYIMKVVASTGTVHALDREIKTRVIAIDCTEYQFKQALIKRNYNEVLRIVKSSKLVGKSIVAYLQKKGFPEVALHFVKDEEVRFSLALECGNISVARESATNIDKPECWHRLGVAALRQGNHTVVEMAYQRTKNVSRLSFLYLITGNTMRLQKMLQIAGARNDVMGRFHNSLYLGDAVERVKLLAEVGQHKLAYLVARSHGLDDLADQLQESLGEVPEVPEGRLMYPPTPIYRAGSDNWPLLTQSKSYFDGGGPKTEGVGDVEDDVEIGNEWGMSDDGIPGIDDEFHDAKDTPVEGGDDDEPGGWEESDSLELPDMADPGTQADENGQGQYFSPPVPGPSPFNAWTASSLAVDHVAAGSFDTAMGMLQRQIGVINFEPLKPSFMAIYVAARASLPSANACPSTLVPVCRNWEDAAERSSLPALARTSSSLVDLVRKGYSATTGGKFSTAISYFTEVLHSIPLLVVSTKKDVAEVNDMVSICREYITGLRVLILKKEADKNPVRSVELAAYFTHCQLEGVHLKLALDNGLRTAYKMKNFITAGSFCRRLLELGPKPEAASRARKVLQLCDQNPSNAIEIDYDERNPFVLDCSSFTPIYKGSPVIRCPYCQAAYRPERNGEVCQICNLSQIGATVGGLHLRKET